jgi:peptide/nickel transport system ATP-binding protein
MSALELRGLLVTYPGPPAVRALAGIDLALPPGAALGILGESGSGKSTLARALLGLLPEADVEGSIRLGGSEVARLGEEGWREHRWRRIALAFQSTASLNPVLRIGAQVAEPLVVHRGMSGRDADDRTAFLLEDVGLDSSVAERFPHELSGGQRRLVLLATALACDPEILVLDEPTAGLDAVTRAHVVALVTRLRAERELSLLVLSHDPDALGRITDRVAVLYRGWLAEEGPTAELLAQPLHPYSWGLLNSRPTLTTVKDLLGIRGEPPSPFEEAVGCPFAPRCAQAIPLCAESTPALVGNGRRVACTRGGVVTLLRARGLAKTFRARRGGATVAAVEGVDVSCRAGEVVGIAGPTGAGKSTLAQLLVRLLEPDGGSLEFDGVDVLAADGAELKALRGRLQLLFQDPYEALSPRLTVLAAVREPLDIQDRGKRTGRRARVEQVLREVRLPSDERFLARHTHELSGGQLQRLALARALVLDPALLVADEPVAMLDPSEQAKMLQLLKRLQVERGMAMVLISHDLAVLLRASDRVLVMAAGRVVEEAPGAQLLASPHHAVSRALLAASGRDALFAGDGMPAPVHPPVALSNPKGVPS